VTYIVLCGMMQMTFRIGPQTVFYYFIRLIDERGLLDFKVVNQPYVRCPPDSVIEGRCHFHPPQIRTLQPHYIFFPRNRSERIHPSQRVKRGWEMKKDTATLGSHDLKGYGVLKCPVQFPYFSIRLTCCVQGKLSKTRTEGYIILMYVKMCYVE